MRSTCESITISPRAIGSSRATVFPTTKQAASRHHSTASATAAPTDEGDEDIARERPGRELHEDVLVRRSINEARFGVQPRIHRTGCRPGHRHKRHATQYGIRGHSAGRGQRRPALLFDRHDLRQTGHAVDWLVAERLSNTLQLTDNLTKIYKNHTLKGGFAVIRRSRCPGRGRPGAAGVSSSTASTRRS